MSTPIDEPVAADAEEIIAAADGALRSLLRDMWGDPHRLSSDALIERVQAMRGGSYDQLRAGLQQIVNELGLYRWGFDLGFEQGYDQAINDAIDDPDTFGARLQEIRR